MKTIKSILALVLAAAMLAAFCGCEKEQQEPEVQLSKDAENQEKTVQGTLTLPIAHNDTLDPFKNISAVNRSLITLLYDSLVYIDEEFQPKPLLAERFDVEGATVFAALKTAVFSDGSAITAKDVVYSFEQAKKSSYYAARLAGITKAEGEGNTVVFTLNSVDVFAPASLDFPIVKSGTVQALEGSTELYDITPPIGSGRYVINGTLPNATLVLNSRSIRNTGNSLAAINLFEVNDSDGLAYGLQIGNYDYWYNDLSSGEYYRVNAGLSVVPTNNLIYLGFNCEKKIFQQPEVRRAVSMLLSRDEIVSQSFQGHAAAALLPFNPAWSSMKGVAISGKSASQTAQAKQLLEGVGYTSINAYGYRCSKTLSLTASLTVCKGNSFKTAAAEQIKRQLAELNFNVNIIELDYEAYTEAIANGEFEMYLGEIKIPANMSLNEFFYGNGIANTVAYKEVEDGVTEINLCVDAYGKLRSGQMSLSDFCLTFESEMPFVPICYRNAAQIYSRRFKKAITGTCYDSFYNIDTWEISSDEDDG